MATSSGSRVAWVLGVLLAGVVPDASVAGSPAPWLVGTPEERFARVERQLRGFDVAMIETDYRYAELWFAGQDRNWAYARYQVRKIRTVLETATERRPKRGPSARVFLGVLPRIEEAIDARDPEVFVRRFQLVTAACNACHMAESLPFFHVTQPTQRASQIRYGTHATDGQGR